MQLGWKPQGSVAQAGQGEPAVVSKPASGMEVMLKSMGLGEVIEAAKMLASGDTIGKIMKFADGVEGLNDRLDKMERGIREVRLSLQYMQESGGFVVADLPFEETSFDPGEFDGCDARALERSAYASDGGT